MPSRVYSVRLVSGRISSVATASPVRNEVPEGKLVIVRSVDIFVDQPGALLFGRETTFHWAHFVSSMGVPQYQVAHWEGRQVIYAGEVLGVQWLSGEHRISASGYVLDA